MSTAESEFVFLTEADLKATPAPRADHYTPADERVSAHAYQSGHLELRSACDGEFYNTDEPADLEEWR